MILYYGLVDRNGDFTLANITAITTPEHSKALWLAILLAVISTVICLILAYPLAYILAGCGSQGSAQSKANSGIGSYGFIVLIFILPMWMNFLLRTLAWLTLLEKTGVINSILEFLRLPPQNIINTPSAIVLGMIYNFLPFMILPIYNSLIKIDVNVVNAARDLGANSFAVLRKIIFPLSIPGVISGITMVFIPALTTFVISNMLGGGKILLIGNIIEEEFTIAGNWHLGSGLSLVLMLFIIVNMAISAIFDKEGKNAL
jgi:spermidine/putrescine transport system permease protein